MSRSRATENESRLAAAATLVMRRTPSQSEAGVEAVFAAGDRVEVLDGSRIKAAVGSHITREWNREKSASVGMRGTVLRVNPNGDVVVHGPYLHLWAPAYLRKLDVKAEPADAPDRDCAESTSRGDGEPRVAARGYADLHEHLYSLMLRGIRNAQDAGRGAKLPESDDETD